MKTREKERRDSGIIILLILLLGFICIFLTSGWALRFAPSWKLNSNMGSNLNPNSDFLTSRPVSFFEPLDPAILTNPAWLGVFLTPGIVFETRTPLPTSTTTLVPANTNTSTPLPTQTVRPTNTFAVIVVVPTNTKKNPPPPPLPSTATPQPPSPPSADLQITNTDNATDYDAGISVQYIIVASNPAGPNAVTGATVTDAFSLNLTSVAWTCAGSGSASCTANGVGDINDSAVNLPVGTSVTYTVNATVIASPIGPLVNTASVSAGITDPVSSNNSKTDTDQLISASTFPGALTSPDGSSQNFGAGSFLDLKFGTALNLSSSSYIVYYPDPTPTGPTVQMGAVILQIGDGRNWYTILNWGDGSPNANTDIPAFPPNSTDCTSEPDNCLIDVALLTNSPGITINVGAFIPAGTYPYIRIISPSNPPDTNGGVSIDAIVAFP